VNQIFCGVETAIGQLGTRQPFKCHLASDFCDLVLRRLAVAASISPSRSEAVLSVCLWWRPAIFLDSIAILSGFI